MEKFRIRGIHDGACGQETDVYLDVEWHGVLSTREQLSEAQRVLGDSWKEIIMIRHY